MIYDALRTIMPIAGWPEERAREVEISVGADPVLPTRFRIGPARGCSERAERFPRGTAHPDHRAIVDEAYLDVTENLKAISSATQIAEEIRARIRAETELSFGRRLLQQVHGMTPDILFVLGMSVLCRRRAAVLRRTGGRFGSRRSPCRRNPPWARRWRTRTKVRASPSSRCFPSHPPQGWQ